MDKFIKILRSFHEGGEDKVFTENFIDLLKERVMPGLLPMYEVGIKFRNNKVILPSPWKSIYEGLKQMHFFNVFVPVEYGGSRTSEENIYFIMELLGYTCPSLGIMFVAHSRAIDLILGGNDEGQKAKFLPRLGEGDLVPSP